jgi:hypothetical protein
MGGPLVPARACDRCRCGRDDPNGGVLAGAVASRASAAGRAGGRGRDRRRLHPSRPRCTLHLRPGRRVVRRQRMDIHARRRAARLAGKPDTLPDRMRGKTQTPSTVPSSPASPSSGRAAAPRPPLSSCAVAPRPRPARDDRTGPMGRNGSCVLIEILPAAVRELAAAQG